MAPSCIDLDITEERPPCFDYQIFPLSHRQCDYYDKFDKPIQILVAFTSVLVQLYVNYVLECLLKLDVTLQDEKKLIEIVYTYASDLRYNFFFVETNYCFFYDLFNLFHEEYNVGIDLLL